MCKKTLSLLLALVAFSGLADGQIALNSDGFIERWLRSPSDERRVLSSTWVEQDPLVALTRVEGLSSALNGEGDERDFLVFAESVFKAVPSTSKGRALEALASLRSDYHRDSYFDDDVYRRDVLGSSRNAYSPLIRSSLRRWAAEDPQSVRSWVPRSQAENVVNWLILESLVDDRDRTVGFAIERSMRQLAEEAPVAEHRAWGLCAYAAALQQIPSRDWMTQLYHSEPDSEVRRLMIRLSALVSDNATEEQGLELPQIIARETDPSLLEDAIRAWVLLQGHYRNSPVVEYFPGRWTGIPRLKSKRRSATARTELKGSLKKRLRELLGQRSEPSLRDACSLALAFSGRRAYQRSRRVPRLPLGRVGGLVRREELDRYTRADR